MVRLWDSCTLRKATAASFQAVKSAIPTLVLEGRLDAITPPAYGRLAAQTLTHSFYVEFPDRGHSVRGDSCSYQIITAFLAQPTIAPDSHCTAALAIDFTGITSNGATNAQGRGGKF